MFRRCITILILLLLTAQGIFPSASPPIVHAQVSAMELNATPTARYRISFDATWSEQTHPHPTGNFPISTAHLSGLVGAMHNNQVNFWSAGQVATDGIELMAETGSKTQLLNEVDNAIGLGFADRSLSGGGIGLSPGTVSLGSFTVQQAYPLLTLVSMIAPSPDWFTGVSGFSLLDENGDWIDSRVITLYPYDAGTDDGLDYGSPNANTLPHVPISSLINVAPFSAQPVGTFTITRTDLPPAPTPTPTSTPTPQPNSCGPLEQEAEDGTLAGRWLVGNDSNASGSQYIYIPDSDGQVNAAAINNNSASYCFSVTTSGTYRVRGWVYAADGRDNSVFLTVNEQPINGYLWDLPINTNYDPDYANNRGGADPIEVTLDAGDHTLIIYSREDGARIDKLALELAGSVEPTQTPTPVSTPQPTPTPTPQPSGCGPLAQEAENGLLFGSFVAGDDPNASGGQYVHVPDAIANTSVSASALNRNRRGDYCVTITQPGDYRIRTQVLAPDNRANSFFVQVDGAPGDGYLYDIFPVNGSYVTDYVSERGGADPVVINLTSGDHTISFIMREDGARLDSFVVEPVNVSAAAVTVPSAAEIRQDLQTEGVSQGENTIILLPAVLR